MIVRRALKTDKLPLHEDLLASLSVGLVISLKQENEARPAVHRAQPPSPPRGGEHVVEVKTTLVYFLKSSWIKMGPGWTCDAIRLR